MSRVYIIHIYTLGLCVTGADSYRKEFSEIRDHAAKQDRITAANEIEWLAIIARRIEGVRG